MILLPSKQNCFWWFEFTESDKLIYGLVMQIYLQCFNTVVWATGRASGL